MLKLINNPADLRLLAEKELAIVAEELRAETIRAVAQTGGHLGAGLGVVELTIALHYVFNTPRDKLIWDVGHQTYPHKILTERAERMGSLRQPEGLSGFTKRSESEYDPFGAGHSSTSVSAALGMAVARDLKGEDYEVIAVIGDGAMSAGMAYEAMNNAGVEQRRLVVILNDNKMSIAPAVGAMSNYLSRLIASKPFLNLRSMARQVVSHLPEAFERAARKAEQYTKDMVSGGNLFEEMGFYYVGPVNGHDLRHLVPILRNIRDDQTIAHPVLVHVVTEKGHGCALPDSKREKLHAVGQFDLQTNLPLPAVKPAAPSYTSVFADELIKIADKDPKIVAITAAMPSGTGLDKFAQKFPDRMFDVGIAEQHAVTFAAGLACEGIKPFCAIYSTFLQRAYDQIVHDVAIQNLPVRFAIDRAGLVGADGATHAGSFDLNFLLPLPGMVVMAAADEIELQRMVATAAQYDSGPIAFRYPRGEGQGFALLDKAEALEIGRGRVVCEGSDVAILTLGPRLYEAIAAAKSLAQEGISVTVADARFAKPLDVALLKQLVANHSLLITVEEGANGGFGAVVQKELQDLQKYAQVDFISLCLPDIFQEHNHPASMYAEAGLDSAGIVDVVRRNFTLKSKMKWNGFIPVSSA